MTMAEMHGTDPAQNMDRIRELTETLVYPFKNTIHSVTDEEIEFALPQGSMKAYRMKENKYFASVLTMEFKDAHFPCHSHAEMEYMIIIEGWMDVYDLEGNKKHYDKNDVAVMPAGFVHRCLFEDNSIILAITVPASKEF